MTKQSEERDALVRAVLEKAGGPISPSSIATLIAQPWCCYGRYGSSAPISPILKRIGAVRHKGGKYTKPEGQERSEG